MDAAPESSATKRTRAKPKSAAAAPVAAKKPRARKPAAAPAAETTIVSAMVAELDGEQLCNMIATAAYYLAAERNFTPGHELEDWLEAERRVRATLHG